MRKVISISSASLLLLVPFALPQATKTPVGPRGPSVATGSQGVVVSGRPAATAAGIKILQQGGNAADAGAATLLALSVTYVGAFCVGGEIPILVYNANQKEDQKNVKLLEGQGEAPRDPKAIAWYMEHGIPDGDVKAAAVPGTIDAIVTLLKLYGTKSFEEVVQPTLAILDAGGPSWYIDTGSGHEDRNRRELAGGHGGDLSQIGRVRKGRERYARAETASRLGPLLSRRHRRRPRSLVYRKGRFPSQGGFGRAQNSRGRSAHNHLPWLHRL